MPEFRFMKTADERLADTIAYIKAHITGVQFQEFSTKLGKLSAAQETALAKELSLGSSGTTSDDRTANRQARRAKRALMLLAHLYIEGANLRATEKARIKVLAEANEPLLLAEVLSWFSDPTIDGDDVAQIAQADRAKMPKWNNKNIDYPTAIRGEYANQTNFNCYNACVFWAFQAGAISRRYLFNKLNDLNGNDFFPTFTNGGGGWQTFYEANANKVVLDLFNGGNIIIPAGATIYFETPGKVFGHIACSLGDGRVASQNWVYDWRQDEAKIPIGEKAEWVKMENGEAHICSIRTMINAKFNPAYGYPRVRFLKNMFWTNIPADER